MTCETCNDLRDKLDETEQALRLVSLYRDESDPARRPAESPQNKPAPRSKRRGV